MTVENESPSREDTGEQTKDKTLDGDRQDILEQSTSDTINQGKDDDSKPTSTDDSKPTSTNNSKPTSTNNSKPTSTDNSKPTSTDNSKPTSTDNPKPTSTDDGVEYPGWPKRFQDVEPEVRECNYYQFKNFHSESEMKAAVYALYGGHSLLSDIEKEVDRRKSLKIDGSNPSETNDKNSGKGSDTSLGLGGVGIDNKVLHRIRIQSAFILKRLHTMVGEEYDTRTHYVFFRPFSILIHLQSQMKQELEKLRNKWAEDATPDVSMEPHEGLPSQDLDFDSTELLDSKHAWAHMEAYVRFIDDKVMPLDEQFKTPNLGETSRTKVAFEDLSYLFREGQYVYRPLPSNKTRFNDTSSSGSTSLLSSYQTLWRVYSIAIPEVPGNPDVAIRNRSTQTKESTLAADFEIPEGDEDLVSGEIDIIKIFCYYIDFDGSSYNPVHRCVCINRYDGEKSIRSLPIYPLEYLDGKQKYIEGQRKSGENFQGFIEQKHVYHFGWTINHFPTGSPIGDADDNPEYIDSQLIIDFQEAFHNQPSWKDEYSHTPFPSPATTLSWSKFRCSENPMETRRWSTNSKNRYNNDDNIIEIDRDSVSVLRRNNFLRDDIFLSKLRNGEDAVPEAEDVCLLPRRLVGFALGRRKFVNVAITSLKPIKSQSQVLPKLKIDENYKKMVVSLVKEHLRQKEKRQLGGEMLGQDVIQGKGNGLVFLLHGVPGVGKTATAEAIAHDNKTPLFAITCGDLGTKPSEVENNLNSIFRWATVWGCILLLDEADVFFTRRNPSDLERNALVTGKFKFFLLFLRILEYYSGILFLTTNRVGIMDEAFKSRVHMSMYYPPLDLLQTQQIFADNINRLQHMEELEKDETQRIKIDHGSILRWATDQFENNPTLGRWNGRQIRNAFQTAASLAHFDAHDPKSVEPGLEPGVLNHTQFDKVFKATKEFDVYMAKTRRATDREFAQKQMIRVDDYTETEISMHKEQAYGTHHFRGTPMASRGQTSFTPSQEPFYPGGAAYAQARPPGGPRQFADYGVGAMTRMYDDAPRTPSRIPGSYGRVQDSAISLGYGYDTQGDYGDYDERSPNVNAHSVRRSDAEPF